MYWCPHCSPTLSYVNLLFFFHVHMDHFEKNEHTNKNNQIKKQKQKTKKQSKKPPKNLNKTKTGHYSQPNGCI